MGSCSTVLLPPYGTYVRLAFALNGPNERDITLESNNFRAGESGRLKYLGWDRQVLDTQYQRTSRYSSQGRSWPTGVTYLPPHKWTGLLVLNHAKFKALEDINTLQQASMKPGQTDHDVLLYDHRIMHSEANPISRPEFDVVGAIARPGIKEYWALFRAEFTKFELVSMAKQPETNEFEYLVNIELKERIPALVTLP